MSQLGEWWWARWVQGEMAVSEDGSYVYFVAKGVLTEGRNTSCEIPARGSTSANRGTSRCSRRCWAF
jgi:hypothetical protein